MDMKGLIGMMIFLGMLVLGVVALPVMVGSVEPSPDLDESNQASAEVVNDLAIGIYSILPALGIAAAALTVAGVAYMLLLR